jgi:hypothetical protein
LGESKAGILANADKPLPSTGKGFFVRVSLEEQGSQRWAQ